MPRPSRPSCRPTIALQARRSRKGDAGDSCAKDVLPQEAVWYFTLAGDRAKSAYANAEAIVSYRAALEMLDESGRVGVVEASERIGRTVEILERLGDVHHVLGHYQEAQEAFGRALSLTAADLRLQLSRLHCKIGATWQIQRQYDRALESYRAADDALGQAPDAHDHAWWEAWVNLQTMQVELHYWRNEIQEMASLVREIRPALEQHATSDQRSNFFLSLVMMTARRDRFVISEETVDYARARMAAAEETGEPFHVATAQFNLGFSLLWHGDLDEAEDTFHQALGFAEQAGDVTLQARCLTYLMILYRRRGLVDEVQEYIARTLAAAEAGGMLEYIAVARANQAWLAWRQGDLGEAEGEGRAALEELGSLPIPYPFHWLALWPLLAAALARKDTARAVAHARALLPAPQQPPPERLASLLTSGIEAWDQGRWEAATRDLQAATAVARDLAYL